MLERNDYKVELEFFEGPLDLLLYLIKKDEVDIYNIPIERITTQYMEYLSVMRMLDLNIAGEFIVMAATLMLIKSRLLLPPEERPETEAEEEGEDPRWELVRQLVEYKKFKDAAGLLQQREAQEEDIFGLGGEPVTEDADGELSIEDVSIFDLIRAFNDVLKRAKPEQIGEIHRDHFNVPDQIDYVLRAVARERTVRFTDLFGAMASRNEIICTFLALLELIRLRQICVAQDRPFGDISIVASRELDGDAADAGDAVPVVETADGTVAALVEPGPDAGGGAGDAGGASHV